MAEMTEEADALDERLTKTTPKIKIGAGGGFFTEHSAKMLILDSQTVRFLNAKAMAVHKSPAELVSSMIRKELAAKY